MLTVSVVRPGVPGAGAETSSPGVHQGDRITCGASEAPPSTAKPTLSNLIFASPFEDSIVVTNPQLPDNTKSKISQDGN